MGEDGKQRKLRLNDKRDKRDRGRGRERKTSSHSAPANERVNRGLQARERHGQVDREKKSDRAREVEEEGWTGELYAAEVASIHDWDLISHGNLASYTGIVRGISSPLPPPTPSPPTSPPTLRI